MKRIVKLKRLNLFLAAISVILLIVFMLTTTKEESWRQVEQDIMTENKRLENENDRLQNQIEELKRQNRSLKTYLDAYEQNVIELKDAAGNCRQGDAILPAELPPGVADESLGNRRIYLAMQMEKKRWDLYQQEQYQHILDDTSEPDIYAVHNLDFANADNRQKFLELEGALNLHRRLIRDVRLFHDEIQYQQTQQQSQEDYELYDLKFKLAPFARESALVDALQQAMSALSAGIYQEEAVAVLDRIGDAFTKPIRQLSEQQDAKEELKPVKYNYNLYALYGEKLMNYSDSLTRQTSIPLGPSAFGELDFFNRQLLDQIYNLYLVGQSGVLDPASLNLDELEAVLNSN